MQKYRILSFIIVHLLIFFHVIWAENSFLGSFDFQEFFDRFLGEGILNAGSLMVIFAFFSHYYLAVFFVDGYVILELFKNLLGGYLISLE